MAHIIQAGGTPGNSVAWYEWPQDDGTVTVHAGFDVGRQMVRDGDGVEIANLPIVEVASAIHHGSMEGISATFESLATWIERSSYRIDGYSRELYHHWDQDDPTCCVTELQTPIIR